MHINTSNTFGVYIHYPYCRRICPYCDFNVYGARNRNDELYFRAVSIELRHYLAQPDWSGKSISSIYFGGGTPSLAPARELGLLVQLLDKYILPNAEVTLEANPEDINFNKAKEWYALGINRISLGVQAVSSKNLQTLGRRHTFEQVAQAVRVLQEVGFINISVDYIFAVPNQTSKSLEADLHQICSLGVKHISAYELTVEKGTPFYRLQAQGRLIPASNDQSAKQYLLISKILQEHGFEHYEISNYGLPRYASRHNTLYWRAGNYLGLGAGAHSFIRGSSQSARRWSNFRTPKEYQNSVPNAVAWQEELDTAQLKFEFLVLGLRLSTGISLALYSKIFKSNLISDYGTVIHEYQQQGLLQLTTDALICTANGRMLLDSIMLDERWCCGD